MKKKIFLSIIFFATISFAQEYPIDITQFHSLNDNIVSVQRNSLNKSSKVFANSKSPTVNTNNNRHTYLVKKYGKKIANWINYKRIWKGMSIEMTKDSWGKPDKISTQKHNWGIFTQLYYGNVTFYFKNGKLTDWEEKK